MKAKQWIAVFLAGALSVSVAAGVCLSVSAGTAVTTQASFDEGNIVTRLGLLSDVHMDGRSGSGVEKRMRKALQTLYTKAGGKLDGISISGDLGDYQPLEPGIKQLKRVLDEEVKATTRVNFTYGNHDIYAIDTAAGTNQFRDILKSYFDHDEADSDVKNANRHTVMGGYHFLSVYTNGFWGGDAISFSDDTQKWLDDRLKEITEKEPNKYVFVSAHPVIRDTVYGSTTDDYWSTGALTDIFKKYPQVVALGGHLHHDVNDERSIWQGDFTALNVPSLRDLYIEDKGYLETQSSTLITDAYSAGYYAEIDNKGNLRLTRLDFYRDELIKQPWILPAPDAAKNHLKLYTPQARIDANQPPAFPEGAQPALRYAGTSTIYAVLPRATDDDMVYSYAIKCTDKADGKVVLNYKSLNDFYLYPDPSAATGSVERKLSKLVAGHSYTLSVTAIDSWGATSDALTRDFTVDDKQVGALDADLFDLYAGPGNTSCDLSAQNLALEMGSVKSEYNATLKNYVLKSDGATSNDAVRFTLPATAAEKLQKGFTMDLYFNLKTLPATDQTLFANEQMGMYVDSDTQLLTFKAKIGGKEVVLQGTTKLTRTKFNHVAVTYDGSELHLFINGTDTAATGVTGKLALQGEQKFAVGPFDGQVLRARIYSKPLRFSELKQLYATATDVKTQVMLGDVNGDGKISALDALWVLESVSGLRSLTDAQKAAADVNSDNAVKGTDALRILEKVANIIDQF